MKFGIVIANWNGEKIIGICLDSLLTQTYKDFKVYIVDNGSTDNSFDIIDKYKENLNISVIKLKENIGFAPANNIGIEQAINEGCEYIFTLNNDTEVEKDCILNAANFIEGRKNVKEFYQIFLVNYYERDLSDSVGLKIDKCLIPTQIGLRQKITDALKFNERLDGVCAGAAIYSAVALKELKEKYGYYFDDILVSYYEDVDLSIRLTKIGYNPIFIKDSIVYHIYSATGNKASGFKQYYLTRNLFIYTWKNLPKKSYIKNCLLYYRILTYDFLTNLNKKGVSKNVIKGFIDAKKIRKSINRR